MVIDFPSKKIFTQKANQKNALVAVPDKFTLDFKVGHYVLAMRKDFVGGNF